MASLGWKVGLGSLPAFTFGLGVWQIQRMYWKQDVKQRLDATLKAEPLDLLSIKSLEDLKNFEYHRVKVIGQFDQDPDHQIFLKPRQLLHNAQSIARGMTPHRTYLGKNVVTPFTIAKSNLRILINRGWIPFKESEKDLAVDTSGKCQEVIGILRFSDKTPKYGPRFDQKGNERTDRDVESMAMALQTAPIYLEAEANPKALIGPIGGQTMLEIRDEHFNYALTWFALTIVGTYMWYRGIYKGKVLFGHNLLEKKINRP